MNKYLIIILLYLCFFKINAEEKGNNECLSLATIETKNTNNEFKDLYNILNLFEKSFAEKDSVLFSKIIHPAIIKKNDEKKNIFDNTYTEYGLNKPKLLRSALFELNINDQSQIWLECNQSKIRSVTGLNKQYMVIYEILNADETLRFTAIFAPVLKSQADTHKYEYPLGLVWFHSQIWTHLQKNPLTIFTEAKKLADGNKFLSAWTLAEGAKRLLEANPYIEDKLLIEVINFNQTIKDKKISVKTLNLKLQEEKNDWELVDYSVVFQTSGLEPALKYRSRKEESAKDFNQKCMQYTKKILKDMIELKNYFKGIECMVYQPRENLNKAPYAGSMFIVFNQLDIF